VEVALRRLDGVASVSISTRTNIIEVTYKPNASFQPAGIREAVAKVAAKIVQLQIVARGRLEADGSNHYFVAGKDRFLLTGVTLPPADKSVSITGTVDDSAKPFKLKIVGSSPAASR